MFPRAALLLLLCSFASAANPGVNLSVREEWVNSLLPAAVEWVERQAVGNFGNFSFNYTFDFGTVHLNFSDVTVTAFKIQQAKFVFGSPEAINFTVQGLAANVTLGYYANYQLITYKGQAEVVLPSLNVSLNISVVASSSHPQLVVNNIYLAITPLQLTSSLLSVTNALVQHEINSQLQAVCVSALPLARQYLPKVNSLLTTLPHVVTLPAGYFLDAGLVSNVVTTSENVLAVGINGTIFIKTNWGSEPFDPPVKLPADFTFSEGLAVSISDFAVNSALYAAISQMNIFIDALPPSVPVSLTTSTLALLLPQLKATYGPNVPVALRLTPGQTLPQFFTDGLMNFEGRVNVEIYVSQNAQWTSAITLDAGLSLSLNVTLHNSIASLTIESISLFEVEVVSSSIGSVSMYLLNILLRDAVHFYLPAVNSLLQNRALSLPDSLPVQLTANDFAVYQGYFLLAADFIEK